VITFILLWEKKTSDDDAREKERGERESESKQQTGDRSLPYSCFVTKVHPAPFITECSTSPDRRRKRSEGGAANPSWETTKPRDEGYDDEPFLDF